MRSIFSTSVADSILLKSRHNELFLRLKESLEREKNQSHSPSRKAELLSDEEIMRQVQSMESAQLAQSMEQPAPLGQGLLP